MDTIGTKYNNYVPVLISEVFLRIGTQELKCPYRYLRGVHRDGFHCRLLNQATFYIHNMISQLNMHYEHSLIFVLEIILSESTCMTFRNTKTNSILCKTKHTLNAQLIFPFTCHMYSTFQLTYSITLQHVLCT